MTEPSAILYGSWYSTCIGQMLETGNYCKIPANTPHMYVCMYVCMQVYVYVYVHVHIHILYTDISNRSHSSGSVAN